MLKLNATSRRVLGGFATAAAVAGTILTAGAGVGQAATASLTLVYNCPFPLIGSQDMSVRIDVANLPASATVGTPIPATNVTATATVPAAATLGLALVGAKTVEGTAKAQTTVNNAGTAIPVTPNLVVAKTNVPSSGAFNTVATGSTPPLTLTKAGLTTISIGNFSTTLTPRKADGSTTGLGTFTSNCTLKAGQATKLYEFTVS
ncbi:hypothetical protein Q5530_37355 [Saccharothrix sp. BKS2]|uniref:DUF6801 domain-containing protein n=1 Tax=Saccharothrix sp. BKS2 TaxID=3064400 RepID=UPI0039E83C04